MLAAMNTGHEGSLSTCHANSPLDALRRVETMVVAGDAGLPLAAVHERAHAALDLIVQVARGSGGARQIVEIAEVGEPDDPMRVRSLAGPRCLLAQPSRPPRRPDAVPFVAPPGWECAR